MNMKEWDMRIAPRLHGIEDGATGLLYHAAQITGAVTGLEARPAWETMARAYLKQAEENLLIALAAVRATKEAYDNLPIIEDSADVYKRNLHGGT